MSTQPVPYRPYGDFRSAVIRKMEFAGGDAAKGDALQLMLRSEIQAGGVAGGEEFTIFFR